MTPPTTHSIATHLDTLLEKDRFTDYGYNGLQIETPSTKVTKVAFAVDAGLSVIEKAAEAQCELLVVHHGILWGSSGPITGAFARKVHLCMTRGVSLYAAHLPLDGHQELGNAAQIARVLDLKDVAPGFLHKGMPIGTTGSFSVPTTVHDVATRLSTFEGALQPPLILPFGPETIKRVGIATGAATSVIPECANLGIDLLITGEGKQEAYHSAKEHKVSVLCMGHYASETFGVRALERVLERDFCVKTVWISEPTGI